MPFSNETDEEIKERTMEIIKISDEDKYLIEQLKKNIKNGVRKSRIKSVVYYKNRGHWGDNKFRGNTTGKLLIDLFNYYLPTKVYDPMEGSGTVRDVCIEAEIDYIGNDLISGGYDLLYLPELRLLKNLKVELIDFIFFHPPYWDIIKYYDLYNTNKDDCLSGCETYKEYLESLRLCIDILWQILRKGGHLVIQLGDKRKDNRYYPITFDIYQRLSNLFIIPNQLYLEQIIIKVQEYYKNGTEGVGIEGYNMFGTPIIPINHEYILILRKI